MYYLEYPEGSFSNFDPHQTPLEDCVRDRHSHLSSKWKIISNWDTNNVTDLWKPLTWLWYKVRISPVFTVPRLVQKQVTILLIGVLYSDYSIIFCFCFNVRPM